MIDYYNILEVNIDASSEEIKKAYRNKARKYHPDNFSNASAKMQKEAEKKFKEVQEAYSVLGDESKRKIYNYDRKNGANSTSYKRPYNQSHNQSYSRTYSSYEEELLRRMMKEMQEEQERFDRDILKLKKIIKIIISCSVLITALGISTVAWNLSKDFDNKDEDDKNEFFMEDDEEFCMMRSVVLERDYSIFDLADKYMISVEELANSNKLDGEVVRQGTKLNIPYYVSSELYDKVTKEIILDKDSSFTDATIKYEITEESLKAMNNDNIIEFGSVIVIIGEIRVPDFEKFDEIKKKEQEKIYSK